MIAGIVGSADGWIDLACTALEKVMHRGNGQTRLLDSKYEALGEVSSQILAPGVDDCPVALDGAVLN